MKRIMTTVSALVALLVAVMATPVLAAPYDFDTRTLGDNVLLVTGPSGNTLVGIDNDGLVLVDGVPEQHAEQYLNFVYQETGQDKVKTLFNSHWHPEQVGLNASLGKQGVTIIAHENTKLWLGTTIRKRGDEIIHTPIEAYALPNETIYTHAKRPFAGGTIEYGYLVQAHTDGDIYIYFPQQNILYTGGMARSDDWAAVDIVTSGFIGGMLDAYVTLLEIIDEDTVIVPASGALMNKAEFQTQFEMYQTLMTSMVALLHESRSPAEVVAADPASALRPEWGDPSVFLEQGFRSYFGHLRDRRHVGAMP